MASTYFDNADPSRPIGLKVEEKTFWVSNQALAIYSPVFKAMFFGDFFESKNEIVQLPDKKAEDILEMLLCLFPTNPDMKEISYDNVDLLLSLADEYQIVFLRLRCQKFFTEKIRVIQGKHNELWVILGLASKYHLHDTMEECAKKCDVYTLNEVLEFMVDFPPLAVALVALYAWKVEAIGMHDANNGGALMEHCSKCGVKFKFICATCKQRYCSECSARTCRVVKMDFLKNLVENMKKKDA